jgi:hypothetical protein
MHALFFRIATCEKTWALSLGSGHEAGNRVAESQRIRNETKKQVKVSRGKVIGSVILNRDYRLPLLDFML